MRRRLTTRIMHVLRSGVVDASAAARLVDAKDRQVGDDFFDLGDAGEVCVKIDDTGAILHTGIHTANKKDLLKLSTRKRWRVRHFRWN